MLKKQLKVRHAEYYVHTKIPSHSERDRLPAKDTPKINLLIVWCGFCAQCRVWSFSVGRVKGLSTREAGRRHATPHMPVEPAKCRWLLKIEPSLPAQTPSKMSENILAKLYNSPKNSESSPPAHPVGSIFSNHQHIAGSTGIWGVAYPLPLHGWISSN